MTNGKRYAVLDTDFVSKTNEIRADSTHVLADRVLEFPEYEFCCHEMLKEELGRHGTRPAQAWLNENIAGDRIKIYTDGDILDMLAEDVGEECYSVYLCFLKAGCDIYNKDFFAENYGSVINLPKAKRTRQAFLEKLKICDEKVGGQQSLGEKKSLCPASDIPIHKQGRRVPFLLG